MKTSFIFGVSILLILSFSSIWIPTVHSASPYAHKNKTVDRLVDEMLLKIEASVKNRNSDEFESYFSPKFDSESWFDRYYSELTSEQLESFVLRRFGYVDARGVDFKFKFSESHNITDGGMLLRSFVAWTKRTPTNTFAINTIRYYGEY